MAIPIVDLKAQNHSVKEEMATAVQKVFDCCGFILGENVTKLEEEVAPFCDAKYGISVNSGTDAIVIALAACGIGPGDEVITTPYTFVATTEAILILGAIPIYADIDPITFNLDPKKIEEKITNKTKAILPVHLYGQCADIDEIEAIAKKHKLKLVSDGAQAIGAKHKGKGIGAYGDASTLSFYPTKNLGGCGDGGMVLTNNEDILAMSKSKRFHGMDETYSYKHVGFCSRLDEIQAAVLRVKLKRLAGWNDARRANAIFYIEEFKGLPITLPVSKPENVHIYHQFTLRYNKRDLLKEKLAERGVGSAVFYPGALHLQRAYLSLGYKPGDFPEAEKAAAEVLSLPVYPELTQEDRQIVAKAVKESIIELS